MLSEFLKASEPGISVCPQEAIPGVKVCSFTVGSADSSFPIDIPISFVPGRLEFFFCLSGTLQLITGRNESVSAESQDILILSQASEISSACIGSVTSGILVEADVSSAESSSLFLRLMNRLRLRSSEFRDRMDSHGGYVLLRPAPWSRSVFSALDTMPAERQRLYCVLKAAEILYLMCSESPLLSEKPSGAAPGNYLMRIVTDSKAYMENHLEEKLTIENVSRRFNISPTAFKSCFRSLYGQPVHHWLLGRRMSKASELLKNTPMAILQIAQSVGYEGPSQFNAVFKRQFGVTPRQYRKMSDSP